MTDFTQPNVSVAGAGLAELPVPMWARLVRLAFAGGMALAVLGVAFMLNGWNWVATGFTSETAGGIAVVVTLAVAASVGFAWLGPVNRLLNIRKVGGKRVYGGLFKRRHAFIPLFALALVWAVAVASIIQSVRTCPLPEIIAKVRIEVLPAETDRLLPIYFWDYATFVDPAWLESHNLVLPYERGLPKRLLPKVYFEKNDASGNKKVALELHGKRPRTYDQQLIHELFDSAVVNPRDWPLLWKLQKEAGLITDNVVASTLYLVRFSHAGSSSVTEAIGVPWTVGDGRLFYWGPDGGVFQAKCQSPCELSRMLELVQFPKDPKGSRQARLDWTKERIRALLSQDSPAEGTERTRHENLLSLYLVSMLTQDPRDPEAFFHLGKLARNRETALSAARYGRDLGLEPMKILEIEATANRLAQ